MNRRYRAILPLLAAAALLTAAEPPPVDDAVRIWPRQEPVHLPTALEQFVFLELPAPPAAQALTLTLELPEGMTVTALPRGTSPAMPPPDRTVAPQSFRQEGTRVEFRFAAGAFPKSPRAFLPLTVKVATPPGDHTLTARTAVAGAPEREQRIRLAVHPALAGRQPKKIAVIACDYPGLQPEFLPTYLEMNRRAGINALYHMRGDFDARTTATDLAPRYGIRNGLIFFIHQVQNYFRERPLPDGVTRGEVDSLVTLLDRPQALKQMIGAFFDAAMAGKAYDTVVFDAERGAFFGGGVGGDRSPYALNKFRAFAKLPPDAELNDELLKTRHRTEWVRFNCEITRRVAVLVRELLDERYPDFRYEIYSGYQLDDGPQKDRTRELYGVDWKLLADSGMDYAVAGYFGSPSQLEATAAAVRGGARFIPAEMYVENFLRKRPVDRRPDRWALRLLRSFLHGDRQGIVLWYANVMDGAALIAVDRLTDLFARTEELLRSGVPDREAVSVRPEAEAGNLYVLRRDGNVLVLLLNPDDTEKTLRLSLDGFQLKGYTGELGIADVMTGEKIAPARILRIKVPAAGFRALQLFDDGN